MSTSCRALATVARSPSVCTLHWCRRGNVNFCVSPPLSALVCETQILFPVGRVHGVGGSILMRARISKPSAETDWHGVKWVSFGICAELPNSSFRPWQTRCNVGVHALQKTGMHNECVPWTSCKDWHLIACNIRAGVWSYLTRMDDII